MIYREKKLPPTKIYEVFQTQMSHGDRICGHIVESMKKDDVISLIGNVRIPSITLEAVAAGCRYGDQGLRCMHVTKFITISVLPLLALAFVIMLFRTVFAIFSPDFDKGLQMAPWCGALLALYMLGYTVGQSFFQLGIKNLIKACTIMANLEATGEIAVEDNYSSDYP